MEKKLSIPEFSLVALIGASSCGKSIFARKHFKPTEILSSDFFRGLVSDDENDQSVSSEAFDALHYVAAKRLAAGKLTVIDATNVQEEARKGYIKLAHDYHCFAVALVLDLPEKICQARNLQRPGRNLPPHVIRNQRAQLRRSLRGLEREGFRYVHLLRTEEEVEAVVMERTRLWSNRKEDHGPFDIIGDVHGCYDELVLLLKSLGYEGLSSPETETAINAQHPQGRKAVFLGDLVDRGPNTPGVLRLVMNMVTSGNALCVPGNHDMKLLRKLEGRNVQITHGLAQSLAQLEQEPPEFSARVRTFLKSLISHYVLDEGKLVVAHAGMKQELQGRSSRRVRDFALYGETTGETDEFGLPVRYAWASEYRGKAMVVYGHTPAPEAEWSNNTINIDTGCVFGGKLTALRYPEKELACVPAAYAYAESVKPFLPPEEQAATASEKRESSHLLDLQDVLGKKALSTRFMRAIVIRTEQSLAALEVMSRFAVNPRWLIYLPPTMSPCETSPRTGLLEHPAEAFDYFRSHGVARVICEEKHMGSRALVIVCKDEETAHKRFGIVENEAGICYTRTGRRFFTEARFEHELLAQVRRAADHANLWEELRTDWLCLDCELMPWSAKAQELLLQQYAKVGAAARVALRDAVNVLSKVAAHKAEAQPLLERYRTRAQLAGQYVEAYGRYCWPVNSIQDLKLAPFHLLASEGAVHLDKSHEWHMQTLKQLCNAADNSELLLSTQYKTVEVTDPDSQQEGIRWWEELTRTGGEGMVVKPMDFVVHSKKGLLQPAIKCRGPEYLRIIYGLDYTMPENLERLRTRGLGFKRALALREFALGIEALERFVRREPLYRVHECVFGVLALESEPVDPRL